MALANTLSFLEHVFKTSNDLMFIPCLLKMQTQIQAHVGCSKASLIMLPLLSLAVSFQVLSTGTDSPEKLPPKFSMLLGCSCHGGQLNKVTA